MALVIAGPVCFICIVVTVILYIMHWHQVIEFPGSKFVVLPVCRHFTFLIDDLPSTFQTRRAAAYLHVPPNYEVSGSELCPSIVTNGSTLHELIEDWTNSGSGSGKTHCASVSFSSVQQR